MSYSVTAIPNFRKEIKKLAKKYPSIKNDFAKLVDSLQADPTQGRSLGNNCYKIRMVITSKGKGKPGGSRVITYVQITQNTVYLLSIFDKSDKDSISNKDIKELIKSIE